MGHMVTFASNGSTCDGYLEVPESGSGPGVIVIQEWWGLVGHVKEVVERFAAAGYVALAPDLYRGAQATEPDEAAKLMMGLQIERVALDLAGAAAYLVDNEGVTSTGVGVVGFCMGGGLALLGGSVSEHIVVADAFYPATPWEGYDPDWTKYAGKSLAIHRAEHDNPAVGPLTDTWSSAVREAGGEVQVYDYPGTSHAFFNDDRPEVFSTDASQLAWGRVTEHFAARLND